MSDQTNSPTSTIPASRQDTSDSNDVSESLVRASARITRTGSVFDGLQRGTNPRDIPP